MLAFYFALWNLLFAAYTLVDYAFFDAGKLVFVYLQGEFFVFNIAALTILLPLVIALRRFIEKYAFENGLPHKLSSLLSIFVSGIIITVDFVYLLYTYLQGDLTNPAFLIKALITAALFAFIFYYFFIEYKELWSKYAIKRKYFNFVFIVVYAIVLLPSYMVYGAPSKNKYFKEDLDKARAILNLKSDIAIQYNLNKKLPESLDSLPPIANYDELKYKKLNDKEFQICAEFNLDFPEKLPDKESSLPLKWQISNLERIKKNLPYKKGENCFKFNIADLKKYAPFNPYPILD